MEKKKLLASTGSFSRAVLGGVLLAITSVTLTACSSSDPALYTLQPVTSAVPTVSSFSGLTAPTLVEIRRPTIPETLDRDRVVLSDSGYKLDVAKSDAWSAPLSDQIPHVLANDLRHRLPGTSFFVQDDATSTEPQAFVELVVTRFSRDASGNAVMNAQVSVHRADSDAPKTNRSIHLSMPAEAGTEGLVRALSTLMGQAADQIAGDIRTLPPAPKQ
ncbi:PqiC family protein [Acetobacter sp. UBA5411]|uniref:PqiC family protein n=1 Tax=Acetobacter sp. UBA5411 TaxID=1945905 RepID=UPI0025C58DA8|nr:PqiC family protein [Acetobacter sp. UBA5411]